MCMYCSLGEDMFRQPRPPIWPIPVIPGGIEPDPKWPVPNELPPVDYGGWALPQLRQLTEALERIKKIEEFLGCPCDSPEMRDKLDFIGALNKRIAELEQALAEEMIKREHNPETCAACAASEDVSTKDEF